MVILYNSLVIESIIIDLYHVLLRLIVLFRGGYVEYSGIGWIIQNRITQIVPLGPVPDAVDIPGHGGWGRYRVFLAGSG